MSEWNVKRITAMVDEALARLGDSPDQWAQNLRDLNCRGVPGSCATCPVAVYLNTVLALPRGGFCNVSETEIVVHVPEWRQALALPMPTAGFWFIQRFDGKYYLNLVA